VVGRGWFVTAGRQRAEHIRARPSWDCAVCGQAWPCANAKHGLLQEFARFPSVLTIFMTIQMYDAFDDLAAPGELPPADLYERFLEWIVVPLGGEPAEDRPPGTSPS
jgi:hypothetical protein